jgi:purine-cytosine permease-like protein
VVCVDCRVSPWGTIVLLEHYLFRRTRGYNLDIWWSQKGLPYGVAGFSSFACSEVIAVLSMSQVWYVGPIALAAGGPPYGMDLGWCLVISFC